MKVIELLTLIAKGEEVPKKIKYLDNEFEYDDINKFYYDKGYSMYRLMFGEGNCLNDEVEIIKEEKKIEKIIISMDDYSMPYVTNNKYQKLSYSEVDLLFASKINELIDIINDMRDKEC